jgi:hypothetical protein
VIAYNHFVAFGADTFDSRADRIDLPTRLQLQQVAVNIAAVT